MSVARVVGSTIDKGGPKFCHFLLIGALALFHLINKKKYFSVKILKTLRKAQLIILQLSVFEIFIKKYFFF